MSNESKNGVDGFDRFIRLCGSYIWLTNICAISLSSVEIFRDNEIMRDMMGRDATMYLCRLVHPVTGIFFLRTGPGDRF